jgi:predicted AAA+ superfamily ATPase
MPEGTVIIDEIQRDLDLTLAIKSSVDTNRRPGRFILTGSSDLLRLTGNPDSLAGRAVTIDLRGFSQGEIGGNTDDFAAQVVAGFDPSAVKSEWTRDRYIAALATGGYPEAQTLSSRMRNLWLDSYVDRILSRNLGDVSRGLSADRLGSVLRLVAANQGGELIQTRLATSLGMPKASIAAYLAALKTLYLTTDLPPWGANLTAREVSRHKVSVADSALAMRLIRLDPTPLSGPTAVNKPVLGGLLEAFVASELNKQAGWSEQPYSLYHFRDSDGIEVDIVLEYDNGDAVLIEVKASSTYGSDQTAGIRALAKRLGKRFRAGIVLGMSSQGHALGDRIIGLPISTLWQPFKS